MQGYLLRRLSFTAISLVGLSILVFILLRVVPGDAVTVLVGEASVSEEQKVGMRRDLGLDKPLPEQYALWFKNAIRGDLGKSLFTRKPVLDEVWHRVPVTFELTLWAMGWAIVVGIPIGIVSAIRQDTMLDQVLRLISILGLAVPNFWLATMVIVFGAIWFSWIPPVSYSSIFDNPSRNLQQFVVPGLILGLALGASLMRITRSSVLEVVREDYVRTAWAKGLRERTVVLRHVLKNALIPVLTIFAVQLGAVLAGVVIIENIFSLPGLGRLVIDAILRRDYPLVQGIVLVMGFAVVFINLATDFAYAWLDPRIRFSGG